MILLLQINDEGTQSKTCIMLLYLPIRRRSNSNRFPSSPRATMTERSRCFVPRREQQIDRTPSSSVDRTHPHIHRLAEKIHRRGEKSPYRQRKKKHERMKEKKEREETPATPILSNCDATRGDQGTFLLSVI